MSDAPPASLRRRQRVYALDAAGQAVLLPALAAILGAEHLAAAGGAPDAVGIARAGRDDHPGAVDRHVVVDPLPALAEVLAAVERTGVALRRNAERGVHGLRIVRRDAHVAGVRQRREPADTQLHPAPAAVIAAEQAHAVGEEHRAGFRRADRERMRIHHALGFGVADDAALQARLLGVLQPAVVAGLPGIAAVPAAHDASDFQRRVEAIGPIGVDREADDAAGEAHLHQTAWLRRSQLTPARAAVAAAVDRRALRAGIDHLRVLGVDQQRPDQALLAG